MQREIIADTAKTIQFMLKENLVPDIIKNENQISLCSPSENQDSLLSAYFYSIEEDRRLVDNNMISLGMNKMQYPPIKLKLSMMVFAKSNAKSSEKAIDEYKIIGKVIELFNDNKILARESLQGAITEQKEEINIELRSFSFEEQSRIWSMFQVNYTSSVFYEIYPIIIPSRKIIETTRVKEIAFDTRIKNEKSYD